MHAWPLILAASLSLVRVADRKALEQLYKLLGGPHWLKNDGWDMDGGGDPCDIHNRWHGVGCIDPCNTWLDGPDCAFGRVTSIILRDNNLTGSITNWTGVGDLHNLTWIEMGFNSISGTLPREIGNIQNLVILNFPFNQIEGTLPDTLGDLNTRTDAELFDLILDRNAISGTLPAGLGKHAGLKMMQLGFNRLSGSIPTEFVNLTNVQVVQLNSNALGGELPEDMGEMRALRYLNLTTNNISGSLPPSLGSMADLVDLHLSENRISGSLPNELGALSSLRHLRMHTNRLDGNFTKFDRLGQLNRLITLDLYENKMIGDLPSSLQNLSSLQYLYLDNQHYKILRQYYCGQRLPNNGKYNYRIVRDDYLRMSSVPCDNMHDTSFAFYSLQESGVYPS